jgi:hypothetical protein
VRVGVGHNRLNPNTLSQEWLLIEWPEGEAAPTKYWLSTLPANISYRELVDFAKLRWRIERDYQELKQESGLRTMKGAGGAASIITPRCASQPTDSWSPRGRRYPPLKTSFHHDLPDACPTRRLPTQGTPLRPERHIPNSIATTRVRLINSIIKNLPRCPCCGANAVGQRRKIMTQ